MVYNQFLNNFTDAYKKPILEDGTIDAGVLLFSRPYQFSLRGVYTTTGINTYVHTFDDDIYPASYSSVTGAAVYCTATNSNSGQYYVTMMQLYNQHALANWNGLFSITSVTAATSSALFNSGKFNPTLYQGLNITTSSFSANVSAFHVFTWTRSVFGDRILDGTINIKSGNSLWAQEPYISRDIGLLTLTSSVYFDTATSVTRFWVFPDYGKIVLWSSDSTIFQALTGVTEVDFYNSIAVANQTINLIIEPDEYNISTNNSFYSKDFTDGQLADPWITTLNLYNPWGECLAIVKMEKPIQKSNVALTIKCKLDFI